MTPPRVTLLGVPIDAVTQADALMRIHAFLDTPGQRHVMTPNSEMLVEASRNPPFRAVLKRSALNLPDSTGLLIMARLRGWHLPERVTGTDTVEALCGELREEHPVFLLGAAPGVAERAADVLRACNPRLQIAGTYAGSPREEDAPEIIRRINAVSPHLLLVAYGSPAQDLWIDRHRKDLPSVRVAIGVGGAFDFFAGVRARAPTWMRAAGLEWLWRVIKEPRRLPRIVTAVIVFPWLCLRHGGTP